MAQHLPQVTDICSLRVYKRPSEDCCRMWLWWGAGTRTLSTHDKKGTKLVSGACTHGDRSIGIWDVCNDWHHPK